MKHRKAKTPAHQPTPKRIAKHDTQRLAACFAEQEQVLVPLLALIEDAKASIDELMSDTARAFVEQLLIVSAQEVAGKEAPRQTHGRDPLARHAIGAHRAR